MAVTSIFRRAAPAIALFVVLVATVLFLTDTERRRLAQDMRTDASLQALATASRLEAELNANVFLANGLVAHIVAQDGRLDGKVMRALESLLTFGRHIRNIGVAPDNRISHVYPIEGNEAALGLYYPDVPTQWPAVKAAMDRRATLLAGPVTLRQGGRGLISRTPVFLTDGTYWGIISIVLDADALFAAAGLTTAKDNLAYALRGQDGRGAQGAMILGDETLFTRTSLLFDISVPGGSWQLAVAPTGPPPGAGRLRALEGTGLVIAFLLSLAAYGVQRERRRVANSERRLRIILETTKDGVVAIDQRGIVQEFNPAAEEMFGYAAEEVVGRSLNQLMPDIVAKKHDTYVAAATLDQPHHMARGREVAGLTKDGREVPLEITVGAAEINGRRMHVGVVRDITERKEAERKLVAMATTDGLTGALNRRAFLEEAEKAVALAQRHGRPLSLFMIDADHFKKINDTVGHQGGDAVLVALADLLRKTLRTSDLFGRFGGEEFILALPETASEQAAEVADRILRAVRDLRVEHDGQAIAFTVSLGIATNDLDSDTLESLVKRADEALYEAKSQGRDQWRAHRLTPSEEHLTPLG